MKFEVSDIIKGPVDQVFAAFRDHIVDLVEYLPNIEQITIRERREEGDKVYVFSHWLSKINLPGPAEKLIPEKDRGWDDYATWLNDEMAVEWHFDIPALPKAVKVGGKNRFVAEGENTRMTIQGESDVDLNKIRGIPNFILRGIVPAIEKVALAAIKPNMLKVNRGVEQYLAARKKGKPAAEDKNEAKPAKKSKSR
jgi:hypothetical protein